MHHYTGSTLAMDILCNELGTKVLNPWRKKL